MEARNQKYSCPDSDEQLDYWWLPCPEGGEKERKERHGTEKEN